VNAEERIALHDAVVGACGEVDSTGWHIDALQVLMKLGAARLSVSEAAGGAGANLSEEVVVLIALGSLGVSVPEVEAGLMAGWALERAGARLPDGIVTASVCDSLDVRFDGVQCTLSGELSRVPWARQAEQLVIVHSGARGSYVFVLPMDDLFLFEGENLAREARDDIRLDSIVVAPGDAHRLEGVGALSLDVLRRGAFGRSALMAGAAQGVYAYVAEYARMRHQFGRPLSAQQAIQQHLAQLAAEASAMTVAVEAAAAGVDRDAEQTWMLEAARIRVAGAAGTVAAIGHQVHGAIGFTDEHPLHRLTTRLWAWREEYGNQAIWSDRLGATLTRKDQPSLWRQITS
jgi:acyl-CoA dehydrogenase